MPSFVLFSLAAVISFRGKKTSCRFNYTAKSPSTAFSRKVAQVYKEKAVCMTSRLLASHWRLQRLYSPVIL